MAATVDWLAVETLLDPVVGLVLEGRYRVERRLARGGMSTVYQGTDIRLDRPVAVKVMAEALASDPAFIASFNREARSAARLSHLNVVSVSDQGEDDGYVFLVMELVRGQTLREVIHERGRLSPAQAFAVLAPTLSGLSAAHRTGLVHRDVKPENILLSNDGVVKVADFGLARAVAGTGTTSVTSGVLLGTVAYLAPEQIERGNADARSDVYAAGVVLYEMLTGKPPYSGDSALSVAYQHVNNDMPRPSDRVPTVPQQLDDLVASATRRDPAARPLDAGAFLAELQDISADLALPTVPVPVRSGKSGRLQETVAHPSDPESSATRPDVTRGRFSNRTAVIGAGAGAAAGASATGVASASREAAAASGWAALGKRRIHDTPARGYPSDGFAALSTDSGHDLDNDEINGADDDEPAVDPHGGREHLRRKRRTGRMVLIVVLILAVVAGGLGWWLGSGRYTVAPNVVGLSERAALLELQEAGLDPKIEDAFSETVAIDRVISADPEAGATIVRGSTVTLEVSKGPERFVVEPALVGLTEGEVSSVLDEMPLNVERAEEFSDTVSAGSVIGFDPAAGSEMRRDDRVTMYVSRGPAPREIPEVAGLPRAEAEAALTGVGFVIAVREDFNSTVPAGVALGTEPGRDAGVQPFGATITLVVSKGPDLVAVPDVLGQDEASARAELEAAGFVVDATSFLGGNRVAQQSPGPDELAERGSTVSILLSPGG